MGDYVLCQRIKKTFRTIKIISVAVYNRVSDTRLIFFEGPKNQKSTFCISAVGLHNIWRKLKITFQLAFSNPPTHKAP